MEDILIKAKDGYRLSVDQWDDGSVWFYMAGSSHSSSCVIPRDQAELLLKALEMALSTDPV